MTPHECLTAWEAEQTAGGGRPEYWYSQAGRCWEARLIEGDTVAYARGPTLDEARHALRRRWLGIARAA